MTNGPPARQVHKHFNCNEYWRHCTHLQFGQRIWTAWRKETEDEIESISRHASDDPELPRRTNSSVFSTPEVAHGRTAVGTADTEKASKELTHFSDVEWGQFQSVSVTSKVHTMRLCRRDPQWQLFRQVKEQVEEVSDAFLPSPCRVGWNVSWNPPLPANVGL